MNQINGVAHMTSLLRTKQGDFTISDCITERDWQFEAIRKNIIPLNSSADEEEKFC